MPPTRSIQGANDVPLKCGVLAQRVKGKSIGGVGKVAMICDTTHGGYLQSGFDPSSMYHGATDLAGTRHIFSREQSAAVVMIGAEYGVQPCSKREVCLLIQWHWREGRLTP